MGCSVKLKGSGSNCFSAPKILRVPVAFQSCNFMHRFPISKFFRMRLAIQITIRGIRQTGVNFHDRTHFIT